MKHDYKGFCKEFKERSDKGLPIDRMTMVDMAHRHNTPIPNKGVIDFSKIEKSMPDALNHTCALFKCPGCYCEERPQKVPCDSWLFQVVLFIIKLFKK